MQRVYQCSGRIKMFAIAIDGPAGAGKSSISKAVAKKLGFMYVDTGALYRTVGLYVLRNGGETRNREKVVSLLPSIKVEFTYEDGNQIMFLNGENVTSKIREPEVSMAASDVSAIPDVRAFLLDLQRSLAQKYNVIMDGRDIGTVILPNAQCKIFLTASPEERAKRRYDEMIAKGQKADYGEVLEDLKKRDYNDTHRDAAPLRLADDGIELDTTGHDFDEVVSMVLKTVRERTGCTVET